MVKIVQIICQISCADRAGGGNSSDWNKRENPPQIPFLSLSGRLAGFKDSFFSTAINHVLHLKGSTSLSIGVATLKA